MCATATGSGNRGIYRLARFPLAARPDLMLWQLWAHNRRGEPQGTYGHNTALSLHALSDVMPAKLDMTVPPGFQRMAAIPRVLGLHGGRLAEDDIETTHGVRVTTPLRTLVDVVVEDRLAAELQIQAVPVACGGSRSPHGPHGVGFPGRGGPAPGFAAWDQRTRSWHGLGCPASTRRRGCSPRPFAGFRHDEPTIPRG